MKSDTLALGPYGAFLFDMDGTILTSIAATERAWTAWAERAGVPPLELLDFMHGRRSIDVIKRFAPLGADTAAEAAWLDARELEDAGGIAPIPGAAEFLAALPPERWAVVTSANRDLAHMRIATAGLPLPAVLVSSEDVKAGKPDPEGYLKGAAKLGIAASECLVFEDADAGVRAGLAAGANVVRISSAYGGAAVGAAATIAGYSEASVEAGADGLRLSLRVR
jgi:sugar-phosphatase